LSSLLNKNWLLEKPDPDVVALLVRELKVLPVVARLLVNRKVTDVDEARQLVDPDLSRLHDPFLMLGMRQAVDRIVLAIESKEKITLFCDYDVDGVTSAAFMTHFFRDMDVDVDSYLPDRQLEGYGLNENAVRKIRESGSSLMITADCGITNVREVELAKQLGLDVIVSDHHQVGEAGAPRAVAVLNPGTIADVAPLTGENHVLCSHGLAMMTVTRKPGLVALKAVSGVDGRVNARSVGFALGPRLNASGRLGKADAGLHLLTATDLNEAMGMARNIDKVNQERKDIQNESQEEAEYLIDREIDLENDRVIVLASENFHAGVIGIVAARLVDKYCRPVVLIALDEGIGKGSGRSIPRFNLFKAFSDCAKHFVQFGGHAYAAGLTIAEDHVEAFRQAFKDVGAKYLRKEDLAHDLTIDTELNLAEIDLELYRDVQSLEPFGAENPMPVFLVREVRIEKFRTMGKDDRHVRFQAVQGKTRLDAVAFGMADGFSRLEWGEAAVDLACELHLNDWNGQNKVELRLLDLALSG
jgi:single-stranded-DNA-specific exonuclease